MKPKATVRIASRASKLAKVQACMFGTELAQHNPHLNIEYVPVSTTGDRTGLQSNLPPSKKDEFIREIEEFLLDGLVDLAIHSMKDVPTTSSEELVVHSVLARADPRDVLVGTASPFHLESNAIVGTASPRRKALLKFRLKLNNVVSVRGNVDTRLDKIDSGDYDAILLAAAGLHRLNLHHKIGCYLDPSSFIPASCQGTLAVEFRADNSWISSLVAPVCHPRVEVATRSERALVSALQADCNSPIGVYCEDVGDEYILHTIVLNSAGTEVFELRHRGRDPHRLAAKATENLIAMDVEQLLRP